MNAVQLFAALEQLLAIITGVKAEPRPGNPPEYPFYLKPIPVNERQVQRVLEDHLSRREPVLMRWLYSTWNADSEDLKDQELRNAIRDGDFDETWLLHWHQRYASFINERMVGEWAQASAASAELWKEGLRKMDLEHGFELLGQRMDEWVSQHSGELVAQLSTAQHEALRNVLRYHTIQKPIAESELSKLLRPLIGLTPGQADAVRRYREALVEEGLAQRVIDHRVGNYSSRLRRLRAKRIARTELASAYNQGGFLAMRDAAEAGAFEGPLVKQWSTQDDERTCPRCGPLDGVLVGMDEPFPDGTSVPPAHPNCRCLLLYEVQGEAKPAAQGAPPPSDDVTPVDTELAAAMDAVAMDETDTQKLWDPAPAVAKHPVLGVLGDKLAVFDWDSADKAARAAVRRHAAELALMPENVLAYIERNGGRVVIGGRPLEEMGEFLDLRVDWSATVPRWGRPTRDLPAVFLPSKRVALAGVGAVHSSSSAVLHEVAHVVVDTARLDSIPLVQSVYADLLAKNQVAAYFLPLWNGDVEGCVELLAELIASGLTDRQRANTQFKQALVDFVIDDCLGGLS